MKYEKICWAANESFECYRILIILNYEIRRLWNKIASVQSQNFLFIIYAVVLEDERAKSHSELSIAEQCDLGPAKTSPPEINVLLKSSKLTFLSDL